MSFQPLPSDIQKKMNRWRRSSDTYLPLPSSYVTWHKKRAVEELAILKEKHGLTIHSEKMKADGWMMDEMQELNVVFETKSGKLGKMHWHPGSQLFFVCGYGSAPAREEDFA